MKGEPAVILFDGECSLCNRAVDFVLRHDRAGRFRFAALQSPAAARLCGGELPAGDTLHLLDRDGRHERSTAVLRIAAGLGWPWSLLRVFRILPRGLRDRVYDSVARRRRRWFGSRSTCRVPSSCERDRFLD
jgi:predicted DCC family thiol-disulfide oxidoreductase YuxK